MQTQNFFVLIFINIATHLLGYNTENKADIISDTQTDKIVIEVDSTFLVEHPDYTIYFLDSIGIGQPLLLTQGENTIISKGPIFLMEATERQTPYILFPTDRVNLTSVNKKIRFIQKNNKIRTSELALLADLVDSTGTLFTTPFSQNSLYKKVSHINDYKLLLNQVNNKKRERLSFIENHTLKHQISSSYNELVIITVNDAAIVDSLRITRINKHLLTTISLDNYIMQNLADYNKRTVTFTKGVSAIGLILKQLLTNDLIYPKNEKDLVTLITQLNDNFEGEVQKFWILNQLFISNSKQQLTPSFRKAVNNILAPKYLVEIDKYRSDIIKNESLETDYLQSSQSNTTLSELLKKHKGKILLIDFWASWCKPCIAEFPFGKELSKRYSETDFVLLYFSIDGKKNDWKIGTDKFINDPHKSFWIPNTQNFSLIKDYNVNHIPRYILINRDGKIINANAPRPSSEELKDWLREII